MTGNIALAALTAHFVRFTLLLDLSETLNFADRQSLLNPQLLLLWAEEVTFHV